MKNQLSLTLTLSFLCGSFAVLPVGAQEPAKPTFGHSMQGEAFNEGPRRKAVLMKGIPRLSFPVTTKSAEAQRFIEQGIAQLHAYWYFEAERSFRQAAALDPNCAMAYWGMARANVNNRTRAKGFCEKAWAKRETVTPRERAYIEAWAIWADADPSRRLSDKDKSDKKKREAADKKDRTDYIAALRGIVKSWPDDMEAKAFLAHELQEAASDNQSDKAKTDETEKLLQEILVAYPMHPIHHYRIHLWDRNGNSTALDSARRNGLSMPANAHMWHMEGHTYTQLKRYADAALSQEASARTDHAHMQRVGILPDQIFNYAHNNQWLVGSWGNIGVVTDALAIAKNLVENPRHPNYNTLEKYSSAKQGISRLIEILERYELWDETVRLWQAGYLEAVPSDAYLERNRLRLLGIAGYMTGKRSLGIRVTDDLEELAKKQKSRTDFDKAIAAVRCYAALSANNADEAKKQWAAAGTNNLPDERAALLLLRLGDKEKALERARAAVKSDPNEVPPLAALVRCLYAVGKTDDAKVEFAKLRPLAYRADLGTPLIAALAPIAQEFGFPTDWRVAPPADAQALKRPEIATLGPLTWTPPVRPELHLRDRTGKKVSLADYQGRNVLVLFYLGSGCASCMTQVNAFAAKREAFAKAGIELIAVSTDNTDAIRTMCSPPEVAAKFSFPILADPDLSAFKTWGAYDDFEKMALHGTFLIDAAGRIRWMDTGFQPFTGADFVLSEAQRLLKLAPPQKEQLTVTR
jgi:peroxiredoxin/tetratricopeptide (TPR) repeat protein